jgi:hypothetical protein
MLYQLSYQGIGRSIAQGKFMRKGFLSVFPAKHARGVSGLGFA